MVAPTLQHGNATKFAIPEFNIAYWENAGHDGFAQLPRDVQQLATELMLAFAKRDYNDNFPEPATIMANYGAELIKCAEDVVGGADIYKQVSNLTQTLARLAANTHSNRWLGARFGVWASLVQGLGARLIVPTKVVLPGLMQTAEGRELCKKLMRMKAGVDLALNVHPYEIPDEGVDPDAAAAAITAAMNSSGLAAFLSSDLTPAAQAARSIVLQCQAAAEPGQEYAALPLSLAWASAGLPVAALRHWKRRCANVLAAGAQLDPPMCITVKTASYSAAATWKYVSCSPAHLPDVAATTAQAAADAAAARPDCLTVHISEVAPLIKSYLQEGGDEAVGLSAAVHDLGCSQNHLWRDGVWVPELLRCLEHEQQLVVFWSTNLAGNGDNGYPVDAVYVSLDSERASKYHTARTAQLQQLFAVNPELLALAQAVEQHLRGLQPQAYWAYEVLAQPQIKSLLDAVPRQHLGCAANDGLVNTFKVSLALFNHVLSRALRRNEMLQVLERLASSDPVLCSPAADAITTAVPADSPFAAWEAAPRVMGSSCQRPPQLKVAKHHTPSVTVWALSNDAARRLQLAHSAAGEQGVDATAAADAVMDAASPAAAAAGQSGRSLRSGRTLSSSPAPEVRMSRGIVKK